MKNYFLFTALLISCLCGAQNNRQNIRGVVADKLSQSPINGATIQLIGKSVNTSTVTDGKGNYQLTGIPPGSYDVTVMHVGYKDVAIPNTIVTAGKELILDIAMEEAFKRLKDVTVSSFNKASTINKLATVSTRTFSMDEVNRYAGGRSDPARLAANFAGVSTPDDSRNDIVIRGNSPVGVLWRIDGMPVTNPNHFASVGTTGGAVSAINTNMLKSSDFFTSAFPAEYGNAVSGVFDLGFRSGNSQKREQTVQLGLITGLEALTEGPIKKGTGSSYLIGYRYSLAGIAQAIGINIGTPSTPSYQDLSFKINSGNTKYGRFTLFGILASSNISLKGGANAGGLYSTGNNTAFSSNISAIGLNHTKQLTKNSFISSSVGVNYSKNSQLQDSADQYGKSIKSIEEEKVTKTAFEFNTSYNTKINSQLFVKAGLQDELIGLNLYYRTRINQPDWKQLWNYNGYTNLAQAYIQAKYNVTDKFTINAGMHSQLFFLNNALSLEPRLGLKYYITPNSSLSFGYGLHSQMQPINTYFVQSQNANGGYSYNNKNLDFTKSNHLVLGYDWQPFADWRVKAEIYYQYLYRVPVDSFASSYSMLNTGASYKPDLENNLVNKGKGRNIGAELTVEKFFTHGYYGLFTSSIYSSKYTGSDGVERNTAFNGKYVYNILVGKEWKTGFDDRNRFSADLKITNAGGRYYTPFSTGGTQNDGAYSSRYPNYFRMDAKIGYTFNSGIKKLSQSFSLDIQNVTNHKNVFSYSYDKASNSIKTTYQLGFFPNFTYKIQF